MQRLILTRLVHGLITLIALSMIVFVMTRLTGNPLSLLMPPDASAQDLERARRAMGLDQPLYVQYVMFLDNALRGNFGNSLYARQPVADLVLSRLPISLGLSGAALALAVVVGIPLGTLAAAKRDTPLDRLATVFATAGMAAPSFVVGILLIRFFAVTLHLLPVSGADSLGNWVLPSVSLSLIVLAGLVRLQRSAMIESLDSEYIQLARTKGLSEWVVIWIHALRNSLSAALTYAGMYFAVLVTMAVVVETVFGWPGIGSLAYQALMWRDYPLVQGVVLVSGTVVVIVNLLVDVLQQYLDPRLRSG